MIRIYPAAASAIATPADYTLEVPDVPISLVGERPVAVSRTISGEAAVSTWPKSIAGLTITLDVLITNAAYIIARRIDDSAYTEWVMTAQGRTFGVTWDLVAATPEQRFGATYWRCRFSAVILEELHR
jgi:hypothetical protein